MSDRLVNLNQRIKLIVARKRFIPSYAKRAISNRLAYVGSEAKKRLVPQQQEFALHFDSENICVFDLDQILLAGSLRKDLKSKLKDCLIKLRSGKIPLLGKYRLCGNQDGKLFWFRDYQTGYVFGNQYYRAVRRKNASLGVDIKRIWELSRLQFLLAPALYAYLYNDADSANYVKEVISDWIRENDCWRGPNWNVAMEAGIRAANIILSCELIWKFVRTDVVFIDRLMRSLNEHRRFIRLNLENITSYTSNHYLGDLIGLLSICSFKIKTGCESSREELNDLKQRFETEMFAQVLPDGSLKEGSISYLRLDVELFAAACVLFRNQGLTPTKQYIDQLRNMALLLKQAEGFDGTFFQIGDTDSGRLFQLFVEDVQKSDFAIRLAAYSCESSNQNNTFGLPINAKECKNQAVNVRVIDKNHTVVSTDLFRLFFNNVNTDMYDHRHYDALSIVMSYKGADFFIDPGTGSYTGRPDIRKMLKASASHSSVEVVCDDGTLTDSFPLNQSLDIDPNSLGKGFLLRGIADYDNGHVRHSREIAIQPDFKKLEIIDIISGTSDPVQCVARFVVHPDVDISWCEDDIILHSNKESAILVRVSGSLKVNQMVYSPYYDFWEPCLVIESSFSCQKDECRHTSLIELL